MKLIERVFAACVAGVIGTFQGLMLLTVAIGVLAFGIGGFLYIVSIAVGAPLDLSISANDIARPAAIYVSVLTPVFFLNTIFCCVRNKNNFLSRLSLMSDHFAEPDLPDKTAQLKIVKLTKN